MESIVLARESNFEDVEVLCELFNANPGAALRVPNSLKESGVFGLEGLVIQMLANWIRLGGEKVLQTYYQNPNEESFDDLSSRLYGICALRFADSIVTPQKIGIPKSIALASANRNLEKSSGEDFAQAFKGFYVAFASVKSVGRNSEYENIFYNGEGIVDKDRFKGLTRQAIDAVVPQKRKSRNIDDGLITNISEILRELFTNTQRHARTDEHGNVYAKNVRAVIIKAVDVSKERLAKLGVNAGGEFALFVGDWLKQLGDSSLPVLDITVVDSGPGLARRWKGRSRDELSGDDEAEAVLACFDKHGSTDNFSSSGSGLTNVLSDLRLLRGWMRLRTGSTLVEKSFFSQMGSAKLSIKDVKKKKDIFMEGTSFNIVIPLIK